MTTQLLFLLAALAGTALLYWLVPKRARPALLLLVSWSFYFTLAAKLLALLAAVTVLTYFLGLAMERWPGRKKLLLCVGLVAVFGTLGVCKYAQFAVSVLSSLLSLCGLPGVTVPAIAAPLGVSFFSFAVCGYLIDVYRETRAAERSFLVYAAFAGFFVTVLSGPIERSTNLMAQLRALPDFSGDDLAEGITRILVGLTKKLLLADQLAVIVNAAYAAPQDFSGLQLLIAACCYSIQIYCDFSAYSDIAVGGARLMGLRLIENFERPYLARSVKEFWRRWHISLSGWFRDYLYFPLGGSRRGRLRAWVNVLIVFTVSGLWHGAAWTFVIWGALNGLFQVAGTATLPLRSRIHRALHLREDGKLLALWQTLITFGLMTVAWVFFRADSLAQALFILRRIVTAAGACFPLSLSALHKTPAECLALAVSLAVLALCELLSRGRRLAAALDRRTALRWGIWTVLVLCMVIFGAYGAGYDPQEFVYFKF